MPILPTIATGETVLAPVDMRCLRFGDQPNLFRKLPPRLDRADIALRTAATAAMGLMWRSRPSRKPSQPRKLCRPGPEW